MKIIFTSHTKEKLRSIEAKSLGIKRKHVISALIQPISVNKKLNPHRSVGELNKDLSLAVIWKEEDGIIKAITFYPAEKGRYERKL